ncbi:MAG: PAS domain S-box protein [Thermodesulfobacteriota bacterium]
MREKKTRFASLHSLFPLIMSCLILILSLPQLFAGSLLLDTIIFQLGSELLTEKLSSLIEPINRRYQTLYRIGLEDSQSHRDEIKDDALATLAATRYKKTGSIFVISKEGAILLSSSFTDSETPEFATFFSKLQAGSENISYRANGQDMLAVARFFEPWQSHIGLSISHDELFAAKNLFLRISLIVLAAALLIAVGLMLTMQQFLIRPIIALSRFAEDVTRGDLHSWSGRKAFLELATLQQDIATMVATLQQQMQEKTAQLEIIKEREHQRDQALADLQFSENRYRAIYNAPSDAIFIHDGATGAILDVNQTMLELYGYGREEAIGLTMGQLSSGIPPCTASDAQQHLHAALSAGPQLFEWHARKKDGSLFWVEVSLKATAFSGNRLVIAVVRDISDRKEAQRALDEEKERLSVTLRSIGDGVITTDTAGRVVMMSKAAEELTGWSQHEAAAKPLEEIFTIINEKTGERCANPAQQVLTTGQVIELANHTVLIDRHDRRRHIADSGAPILDKANRIIGVVLVFRDVTEKLRFAEEMLKVKKLESIGVLAGGIAHDFNNILTAILGNVNLARLQAGDDSPLTPLLNETEKAALRARNLTRQLLTFAKGGTPVRRLTSITEIIRESATFVLRGSNVTCEFQMANDLWLGDIDADQISQVIQNMVINARQAMPDGGTILISCRNRPMENNAPSSASEFLEISISDSGIGIPAAFLDKIFDPYFTMKEQGTGLGLAICHSIVRNHGGSITVNSSPGRGTTFTLLLPASREKQKAPTAARSSSATPTHRAKILVMDDEELVRAVLAGMLSHIGCTSAIANDGQEAIRLYRQALEEGSPFDAVIMDLTIPGGMGGKEAVSHLLALDQKAKVIVASGYSNDPIMADYRRYGFCAAIGKPFQLDELIRTFTQALNNAPASPPPPP